jgi:hypothetical protein
MIWDGKTKDFALNGSKHFLKLICSKFLCEWNIDLLLSFPGTRTLPHFQTIYYHLVIMILSCIVVARYNHIRKSSLCLLLDQPPY